MRIVAGRLRGRVLEAPPGDKIRPTSDRAREALFNILSHGVLAAGGSVVAGARVLDAFAGTGALGLEALSRGAEHATFLDQDPRPVRLNVAKLGEETRAAILTGDATRPPRARAPVSLAFLDPPYGEGLAGPALVALSVAGWFAPTSLAVVEVGAKEAFEPPEGFTVEEDRRYGAARLLFLRAP
jgi:16S rRNA (guanine966-N2)-methyltransferase